MNSETITIQVRHVPRQLNREAKRLALAADVSLNQWYLDLIRNAVAETPGEYIGNCPVCMRKLFSHWKKCRNCGHEITQTTQGA